VRLSFWTWVVGTLDEWRLYARARKMQAISDRLMQSWEPIPVDKSYDANMQKAYGKG
jgi:hypothetical protein